MKTDPNFGNKAREISYKITLEICYAVLRGNAKIWNRDCLKSPEEYEKNRLNFVNMLKIAQENTGENIDSIDRYFKNKTEDRCVELKNHFENFNKKITKLLDSLSSAKTQRIKISFSHLFSTLKSGEIIRDLGCEQFLRSQTRRFKERIKNSSTFFYFSEDEFVLYILSNIKIYLENLEIELKKTLSIGKEKEIKAEIEIAKLSQEMVKEIKKELDKMLIKDAKKEKFSESLENIIKDWEEEILNCKKKDYQLKVEFPVLMEGQNQIVNSETSSEVTIEGLVEEFVVHDENLEKSTKLKDEFPVLMEGQNQIVNSETSSEALVEEFVLHDKNVKKSILREIVDWIRKYSPYIAEKLDSFLNLFSNEKSRNQVNGSKKSQDLELKIEEVADVKLASSPNKSKNVTENVKL